MDTSVRNNVKKTKVCVTGGIACGKSLAGVMLKNRGLPVIEADHVCHDLIAKDSEVFSNIVSAFGRSILDSRGEIDRTRLGEMVFADRKKLDLLGSIVHPTAREAIMRLVRENGGPNGARPVVGVVPLAFESGWDADWDMTVCVASPADVQLSRLIDRGLTREQAVARISSQMKVEEKMVRSDRVIFNSGSRAFLEEQISRVFSDLLE